MALSRSAQMARIRGRDTTPETLLRRELWRAGLRYRVQARTPVGRPDVVFVGARVAVFVDGCQWHGCPDHYVRPRTREAFWSAKLAENVARDRRQTLALEALGWRVVRVWEHEVHATPSAMVTRVAAAVSCVDLPNSASSGLDPRVVLVEVIDAATDLERRHIEDLRDPFRRSETTRIRTTTKGFGRRPRRDSDHPPGPEVTAAGSDGSAVE